MAEPSLIERLRACELLSSEQIAELEPLPEASNPDPKILALPGTTWINKPLEKTKTDSQRPRRN